jgi:ubiquinone/menaquinone biosynthesis C-methylase UbiE
MVVKLRLIELTYVYSNPPTNCHFQITDYAKDLPFEDNTFDFVVQREARFKHTKEAWERIIREAIRVTKPGGYLEFSKWKHNHKGSGCSVIV